MAKKKVPDQGEDLDMDMSPMIDCVFLLLIFFIVVSTQAEVPIDDKVDPVIASESQEQKENLHRVVINAYTDDSGSIVYTDEDTKVIDKANLKEHIRKEKERKLKHAASGAKAMLHLRSDRNLTWGEIQVVHIAAAENGILDVNFAGYQENPK